MPKKIEKDKILPFESKIEVPNCKKCQWSIIQQNRKFRKKEMLMSACSAQGYIKLSISYNTENCKILYQPKQGE